MDRRAFIETLGLTSIGGWLAAEAQEAGRVYRLGMLTPGVRPAPSFPVTANLLPLILRELGYVEGQNLVVERRFAEGKLDRLPGLARELVQLRVDILVAASPPAVQAAKDATKTIPIVMLLSYSDPVELGFVASFARPGGNISGVLLAAERTMAGKRLELIKEVVPRAARIAVLATGEAQSRTQVQGAEKAAPSLGVKLVVVEVRDADYDRAFATMVAERADALFVVASVILSTDRERIIQLAAKHRLPAIYDWREHVEAGGLMAYGGSISGFTRRAAVYVDRVFKGANPADLPVDRATTCDQSQDRQDPRLDDPAVDLDSGGSGHRIGCDHAIGTPAHCLLGLGKLYRRTGQREQAQEHLMTATTMYREMDMWYWLEKAEEEMKDGT